MEYCKPRKEAVKLPETIKQLQLPPDNDFVNNIKVIVYGIVNIEKTNLSLREKALAKMVQGISKPK